MENNETMISVSEILEIFEMDIEIHIPEINYEEKSKHECYSAGVHDGGAATRMFFLREIQNRFSLGDKKSS